MEKRDILYLFDRPLEPIFYPKGYGQDEVIFDVPADFLTDEWKSKATLLLNKFNAKDCRRVDLGPYITDDIYKIDFKNVLTLDRTETASTFFPKHQEAAEHLVSLFMSFENYEKLIVFAAYCRDRVNIDLFNHALSVALVHREDMLGLFLPLHWQIFPGKFFDPSVLQRAKMIADIFEDPSEREPVEIPVDFTGTDGDPEHRLAYWREDIGINVYHLHWHLVYPVGGNMEIVNKDRRGESFFYIHNQILNRFNIERLCNNMGGPAERFMEWRKPINIAYFPKLTTSVAGQNWASRPAGLVMQDLANVKKNLYVDIADMDRWRDRLFSAIHTGFAVDDDGKRVELDEVKGIDILGNLVEGNAMSINRAYYGRLHGSGHSAMSNIHDPKGFYKEPMGVLSNSATAIRDPLFFGWHGYLDDLFWELKDSFKPYSDDELVFSGIEITKVGLCTVDERGFCKEKNKLNTFWQKTDIDLSRGLDFAASGSIYARVTHLNHEDFVYTIEVNNRNEVEKYGTVRIFLAAIRNFEGDALKFPEQKKYIFEMDKFIVTLQPGKNKFSRKSTDSAITIPFDQTFRDLNEGRPPSSDPEALDKFNFCGCGWPQHMLVPKGTATGYDMELFVMISNYEDDKIDQPNPEGCKTGVSFCGLKNLKYPDKRNMGYPFDRLPASGVKTIQDFLKPNMNAIPVVITHINEIRQP